MLRYGLPYKGSKNAIAKWIVDNLPRADTFVDFFCGGGAVTHAAMLSGKWDNFIMNDIDARLPKLFKDCIDGKYTVDNRKEWITQEDFNRFKDKDAYVALVWSFANNGKDYLYGKNIERYKQDYHRAIYQNNPDLLNQYGYCIEPSDKAGIYERYHDFKAQIRERIKNEGERLQSLQSLESLERLQNLQSLQSLQNLQNLQNLQSLGIDYRNVNISDGAVIYCDIPYRNTNCGKYQGFEHDAFYEWAAEQDNIFISEYQMPDGFIPIAKKEKNVLSAAKNNTKTEEILWTNKKTYSKLKSNE